MTTQSQPEFTPDEARQDFPSSLEEWPRAYSNDRPSGIIKWQCEDFMVDESLLVTPSGSGEHLYLKVQKTDLTTKDVASILAKHYGLPMVSIGYAGLKDKRSVSSQWFSVGTMEAKKPPTHSQFCVLKETRHVKKLRRTDCESNRFAITIREFHPKLSVMKVGTPIPNYFGEQRFGKRASNLRGAIKWLRNRKPKVSPWLKSIYLSTLRSVLFNAVLAERIRLGNWDRAVDGDVLADAVPTAPLWGRGKSATEGIAGEVESQALKPLKNICDELEWVGLSQARRPLSVIPQDYQCDVHGGTMHLTFELPSGSYATSVLREIVDYTTADAAE